MVAGLDVGSRTIKLVILDSQSGEIAYFDKTLTTFDAESQCRSLLHGARWDHIVSTGYGRKLAQSLFEGEAITEIQAHALGARGLCPDVRSILDIGGQDSKAIAIDDDGLVRKFEMNDRCAAGTGKFLEFMATSFQTPLEEFGKFALRGRPGIAINSMCTVFAESEATSLMARGNKPEDIALALHVSVVKRALSMLKRTSSTSPLVFSGGVARNVCASHLIEQTSGYELLVPPEPDMVGALGAALHGARNEMDRMDRVHFRSEQLVSSSAG